MKRYIKQTHKRANYDFGYCNFRQWEKKFAWLLRRGRRKIFPTFSESRAGRDKSCLKLQYPKNRISG